mgnify:CR=1 FL=1
MANRGRPQLGDGRARRLTIVLSVAQFEDLRQQAAKERSTLGAVLRRRYENGRTVEISTAHSAPQS